MPMEVGDTAGWKPALQRSPDGREFGLPKGEGLYSNADIQERIYERATFVHRFSCDRVISSRTNPRRRALGRAVWALRHGEHDHRSVTPRHERLCGRDIRHGGRGERDEYRAMGWPRLARGGTGDRQD